MLLSAAQDSSIYLNFYEQSQSNSSSKGPQIKTIKRQITNVSPILNSAMCLEISKDDKTLFVGGSTHLNVHGGNSAIAAIQFNQYLVHLDSKEIGHQNVTKNVFELKRFESKKYTKHVDKGVDILFASCFQSLVIVEWRDHFKKFVELRVIDNLHTAEIFDFVVNSEDEIYAVCGQDEFISKF